jgi:hypothetical protein
MAFHHAVMALQVLPGRGPMVADCRHFAQSGFDSQFWCSNTQMGTICSERFSGAAAFAPATNANAAITRVLYMMAERGL